MIDFVKAYDKKGVTKQLKFDAKGESADDQGLRLQGRGRQDRRRRRDQVAPSVIDQEAVGAVRSDRPRRLTPALGRADRTAARGGLWMQYLIDNFFALTITGLTLGAVYALVALGYTLVYGVLRLINFAHSEVFMFGTFAALWVVMRRSAARLGSQRRPSSVCWSLRCSSRRWRSSGGDRASLLERVAYRPLRKRNAPAADRPDLGHRRVVRPRRDHGPARQDRRLRRPRRRPRRLRRPARATTPACPRSSRPGRCSRSVDYQVTNVDLLVIVGAIVDDGRASTSSCSRSRLGRGIRAVAQDPESAALMGVNSTGSSRLTFLLGGLMAGAAAALYMIRIGITRLQRRLHPRRQGVHRRRPRRHRQPARRPARRPGPRRRRELRLGARSAPSGRTSSPSSCSS